MSSPLIPSVVVEVIATVSGVIVSIGIPLVLTKLNKINKVHTTVFGLQEVSSVGGLDETVKSHENRVEELEEGQNRIESKVDDLESKVDRLNEYITD